MLPSTAVSENVINFQSDLNVSVKTRDCLLNSMETVPLMKLRSDVHARKRLEYSDNNYNAASLMVETKQLTGIDCSFLLG